MQKPHYCPLCKVTDYLLAVSTDGNKKVCVGCLLCCAEEFFELPSDAHPHSMSIRHMSAHDAARYLDAVGDNLLEFVPAEDKGRVAKLMAMAPGEWKDWEFLAFRCEASRVSLEPDVVKLMQHIFVTKKDPPLKAICFKGDGSARYDITINTKRYD